MEPEITSRFANKLALDFITDNNTHKVSYTPKSSDSLLKFVTFKPKTKHIMIKKITFFFVPKWSITFTSIDSDYSREILAYSGNIIEDTIANCPNHFSLGKLKFVSKKNIAICEVCDQALCEEHIKQCPTCGKWLGFDHGLECEDCRNLFCIEHTSINCVICGKPLCDSCVITCPICRKPYARTHQLNCDKCSRVVCPSCIVSEGFIRKKHYCTECKS